MNQLGVYRSHFGLESLDLQASTAYWNIGAARLVERAIESGEGRLTDRGALVVRTGQFTGRSPKDKYIVRDATTENTVAWGSVNQPMSSEHFKDIWERVLGFLQDKDIIVEDLIGGADPEYSLPIRVVTLRAWHALFARQLFIRPQPEDLPNHNPEFTLVFVPDFEVNPKTDGTRSETAIIINFTRKLVLIAGTCYAGEMKKSVFTLLNYLLPEKNVLPMHCSANVGDHGRAALFFGLSGTGKTTLSADRDRRLVGDDEHGWSERGLFNFEGGCYAKCIRLSKEAEPQIYNAIRYGVVLENVKMDLETRLIDFDSDEYTENTRAAYRIDYIDGAVIPGMCGQPNDVVFLTADAFGVMPPISKLTPEQAMYHFLNGYTARVAGTERGLGSEPQATFSACFGEPFLPRDPLVYAKLLGEKLRTHNASVWLINTGWTAGKYGVGHRMSLAYTRAIVHAAIEGGLAHVPCKPHPVFRVLVPEYCPGVASEILDPRSSWADKEAYDHTARDLASRFQANFKQKFSSVGADILAAGPVVD